MNTQTARVTAPRREVAETVRHGVCETELGPLLVATTARGLCALYFIEAGDEARALARLKRDVPARQYIDDPAATAPLLRRVVDHVVRGSSCDDLPLDLHGTPFQIRVWNALRAIPRGQTTSYGILARDLGLSPGSARAVGAACGSNPVSLLVACHRVLGAGGGLGGYYWGLDVKQRLLEIERTTAPNAGGSASGTTR